MNSSFYYPNIAIDKAPLRIAFLLTPGFALTSFALAVEAFSVANRIYEQINGQTLYTLTLYHGASHPDTQHVLSSNQIPIQLAQAFTECRECDTVFICAYQHAAQYEHAPTLLQLKRLYQQKKRLASLSSGVFLMAKAGLLTQKTCTLVQEQLTLFKELYPTLKVQDRLFTVHQNILSCAGGMSALDMVLYILSQDYGQDLAFQVSHQFLQERMRSPEETQNKNRYLQLRMQSHHLAAAIEIMEEHIENPPTIQAIAHKIGTTPRTLENVFKRHLALPPNQYYLKLRLQQAQTLLEETQLPISAIAQATGFASQSYFGKRFHKAYGSSPQQYREKILVPKNDE